jgi:hypothetical protein
MCIYFLTKNIIIRGILNKFIFGYVFVIYKFSVNKIFYFSNNIQLMNCNFRKNEGMGVKIDFDLNALYKDLVANKFNLFDDEAFYNFVKE